VDGTPHPAFVATRSWSDEDVPDTTGFIAGLRPTIELPPPGIDPRALRVTLHSQALGIAKSFYVFVPPLEPRGDPAHAAAVAPAPCPTLYLLRGHEREWVNPTEDSSRDGKRTVIDVYLRLHAAGLIGPMILVFPGVTSEDNRMHGAAVNLRGRALLPDDLPGVGSGRFEDYLVREVIPAIDALFPALGGGRHRGVDGFSLGGFMAARLAAGHPDLFATAGAYDGTFLYANARGTAIRADDRVYRNPILDPAFGRPRDGAFAAAHNAATLALRANKGELDGIRWLLQYGAESLEPWGSNYYRGRYLRDLLLARGLDVADDATLPPVLDGGVHDWATADRHMELTLPLHWAALRG